MLEGASARSDDLRIPGAAPASNSVPQYVFIDEVSVEVQDMQQVLWRAVDQKGEAVGAFISTDSQPTALVVLLAAPAMVT